MLVDLLLALVLLQTPRSQHGTVTQNVAGTQITISYNRPVARGRELFGTLVHWGRIWHPGADSVTTIAFSAAVKIDGRALAAGRYSLWTIPEEAPRPWTVIFNRGVGGWHTSYPGESQDALRITVTPETGAHMETLSYYFPMVDADSAVLRLHWGTTVVPLMIRAQGDRE
ncbi:MAG: DUF2911 domain-containing protein [Gemmatimonadales bacterium]